jgi:hypothetical protein
VRKIVVAGLISNLDFHVAEYTNDYPKRSKGSGRYQSFGVKWWWFTDDGAMRSSTSIYPNTFFVM